MSKITEAIMGRTPVEESGPALSAEAQRVLEAFEADPESVTESKKHLIDILQLALKMDSVNSIKHMVRRVLKTMAPDSMPKPPGMKDDKDAKPPEPPAKRPPPIKVPQTVPSAA